MVSVKFAFLCSLAAFPVLSQQVQISVNGVPYSMSFNTAAAPFPHFELRAEPALPRANIVAGYLSVTKNSSQVFGVGHRYFYDEVAHTYFGYDIVVQPEPQPDAFRVTYRDLSIGPLDFTNASMDSLDPTQWKRLSIPALPAPKVIQVTDTIDTDVFVDPQTGQKLIDTVSIVQMPQPTRRFTIGGTPAFPQNMVLRTVSPVNRTAPTVSGTAREFSVDDAEMHIQQARITFNGVPQDLGTPSRLASGSLVWFYLPNHGRYILSLSPRSELGFVKAGEVRGGVITFTLGKDQVVLESPVTIAPGDAPYVLYVLHDGEWAPTAQGQTGSLLLGSVSARELAALVRK